MRFDAPTFARAWLAVSQAAHTNPDQWYLYRAVSIEEYATGARLVSTDGRMMLAAWVPDLEHTTDEDPGDAPEPSLGELPAHAITVRDVDHRAKGLLQYAIKLLAGFDKSMRNAVGLVKLDLHFDIERPVDDDGQPVLDGMNVRHAALELPDAERVYIEKIAASEFPEWRDTLHEHDRAPAADLRLNPELLGRLAAAAARVPGAVNWSLAGDHNAIVLAFESPRPIVGGFFYPMREVVRDLPPEVCNACDDPDRLCLKHAAGVIGSSLRQGGSLTLITGGTDEDLDDDEEPES